METTKQTDLTMPGILGLFKFNHNLFEEKIGALADEMVTERVSDHANPIIWIAGHLVNSRVHILELLGDKREYPWSELFNNAYDPDTNYPSISTLKEVWAEVSPEIFLRMESLTHEDLSANISYKLPHQQDSLAGALVFWLYHEAWHLGQYHTSGNAIKWRVWYPIRAA